MLLAASLALGLALPALPAVRQLQSSTTEQVVWRDAASGAELARSDQFPRMSPGILVTPGFAGLQDFLTLEGHIIALQVTPA